MCISLFSIVDTGLSEFTGNSQEQERGTHGTDRPDAYITVTGVPLELIGTDGNAFAILGKARAALRRAGIDRAQIAAFVDEASSGDYDHLLATCMEWFEVS